MDIVIEFDNEEIKSFIRQDLEELFDIFQDHWPPLNISQIIVPLDFERKINELEGTTTYQAKRALRATKSVRLQRLY